MKYHTKEKFRSCPRILLPREITIRIVIRPITTGLGRLPPWIDILTQIWINFIESLEPRMKLLGADVGPEGDQFADVLRTHFTKVSPTTCLQKSSLPGYRARARKHT